ncbi:hypothetical protein [Streptomyces sp. NPDC053560]|uniref:hypothetical protein n=1 Tax=Streptomyces sp. NPDC053560 TaxID=3365711 RepID=UPI0037D6FE50
MTSTYQCWEMRAVEITPEGLELFDAAAHVAANPLGERLVAHLGPGEPAMLMDLPTRLAHPADGKA